MKRNHSQFQNQNGTSRQLDNLQSSNPLRAEWRFLNASVRWLESNKEWKKSTRPLGSIKERVHTSLREENRGLRIWVMQTHWRGKITEKGLKERLRRKRSLETPLSFVAGSVFPKSPTIHLHRQRRIATHHSAHNLATVREYSKRPSLAPLNMSLEAEPTVQVLKMKIVTFLRKARVDWLTSLRGHAPFKTWAAIRLTPKSTTLR